MVKNLSDRRNMFYWQTNRPLTASETRKIFIKRHKTIGEILISKIVACGMKTAGYKNKDTQINTIHPIIKQGSVNSVIPVCLQSGRRIVLRIHPKGIKNGYFWVEKTASTLAGKLGVPTYETIMIDDTQKTVPFDFMITTHLNGKPIQELLPLKSHLEKKLVRETGKFAALIHTIKPARFGFFENNFSKTNSSLRGICDTLKDHVFSALADDLKYLVDHGVFDKAQHRKIDKLFNTREKLFQINQGSLIHNDIADWNEMSDGNSVTAVMDWDECISGDPLMELAAYSLFYSEPRLTWFKEGYNEIHVLESNEEKFQILKLRYLISKLHLRKKRSTIDPSPTMKQNLARGLQAAKEVYGYFRI